MATKKPAQEEERKPKAKAADHEVEALAGPSGPQRALDPVNVYGRSGSILLLNPTSRNIGDYVAPPPFVAGLTARSARNPLVVRASVVPVYDPTAGGASTATITTLTPATAVHGAADVTVTLTGTGYTAATVVLWDGVQMLTTFSSATSISFVAPILAAPAAKTVAVQAVKPGERPCTFKPFTIT